MRCVTVTCTVGLVSPLLSSVTPLVLKTLGLLTVEPSQEFPEPHLDGLWPSAPAFSPAVDSLLLFFISSLLFLSSQ